MTRVSTSDARRDFADAVNRVSYGQERIVLHRHGKDIAALVPISDLELLRELEDVIDLKAARKALAEARTKGNTSWDALKRDLKL